MKEKYLVNLLFIFDLNERIKQFRSIGKLIITNSPTFTEKSSIFKKSIFVVGYDTALRLIDKKYYSYNINDAYNEIKKNGCSLLAKGEGEKAPIPPVFGPLSPSNTCLRF